MKNFVFVLLVLFTSVPLMYGDEKNTEEQRLIDIVFCVDTSGSMERIIASAKMKIWSIVNDMVKAKPTPNLRIGLIAYAGEHDKKYGDYPLKIFDLSEDLDDVYKNLHSSDFNTSGGSSECVGRAIRDAVEKMNWSKKMDVLKIMFVIGNEPADQDPDKEKHDYKKVASYAIKNDIIVNTIYGGDIELEKSEPQWQEIARLADGSYTRIDLSGGVVSITTPFDKELAELSAKINTTYLAYGKMGEENRKKQSEQDENARKLGLMTEAERASSKAQKFYVNSSWDLIDAFSQNKIKLEELKKEDLPKEMQEMSIEEQKSYIEKKLKDREEIKNKILELSKKREEFVKEELSKQGDSKDKAFDEVIKKTLRQQAEKKNFKFE